MGRPRDVNPIDWTKDTYICKFCRKTKKIETAVLVHITEGVCSECMEKGW